ncbi:hypothetical protein CBP36_21170 (plasmid) [Acidovorax carolinensis]|uniref:Uncharacterized protein n=1 Tax=Acidovorax carolinensis TaxID=553814 RepID=A0A240UJ12_9BURK|nr:hypothetical protein [Acidovorax carolinensis]ART61481.1 hypothetical protein CBP36_21170 [Acidovorax carolinensis]
MAKFIGAVRFQNGDLAWFLWNGVIDMAMPRLFRTREEASDAWDDPQRGAYEPRPGGDVVDVMPLYDPDIDGPESDARVFFRSRADRDAMVLIGPLSLDRAMDEKL